MRNKHKWYSILLLGLVLLLASSVVACVKPPVIVGFSATPTEIDAGKSVTLAWNVTGATAVNIDQGIGKVPASGTISVSPSSTTAYTLTASNKDGTVSRSVVITVRLVPQPPPPPPSEVIDWTKAKDYIGKVKVVEGHVASATWASGSKGKPTFLNIGNPYPNPNRFTVVIWIDHRDKFIKAFPPNPETYFLSKTVRVRGLITSYKGIPQIELQDPSNIWIVK